MRNSSDGRFVANGGGPGTDGAGAVVADLAASLDPAGPKTRDIVVSARYDPDFSPRDDWFVFQGNTRGGFICSTSLLKNPATTRINLDEAQCSRLDGVRLYQSVGQVIGDNSVGDSFIVNSKFSSDNPGLTMRDHDLPVSAGPDAAAQITVAIPKGNDADEGFEMRQKVEIKTKFEGDTMMGRSGHLLGSRVGGEAGVPLGYAVNRLQYTKGEAGYRFALKNIGRICMPGNKANFSFDERFMATHHYLEEKDYLGDSKEEGFKEKGAADIYVADFVTGKKVRITRMGPGQFAIFPHFRSDGWLYFLVRDGNTRREYVVASDWAIRAAKENPT
jgi:hypothetical protein